MAQANNAMREGGSDSPLISDGIQALQRALNIPDSLAGVTGRRLALRAGERRLIQAFSEAAILAGGVLLILTLSLRHYPGSAILASLAIVLALWFFFADAFGAYDMQVMHSASRSMYQATKVLVVTWAAYLLVAWLVGGTLPVIRPRITEIFAGLLLVVPLILTRAAFARMLSHAALRRHVVIIGANRSGREMAEALALYGADTYRLLGFFDDLSSPRLVDVHSGIQVHSVADLPELNDRLRVDQIVLANPVQTPQLLQILGLCHERGIQITPMFALYQDLTGRVPVGHLGKDWFVALPANVKPTTRTYMVVKRAFDILMALGLLVVTAPLIPLIALVVKLDSPGPVFFRQVRMGQGGKLFRIVKFRSMRQDAEHGTGAVWAQDGDARITRVGKFLRKSRLDEIPQLWNVLVGDMSFVGPRPERPEFDEKLEREIPFYRARRAVRPGLTGWAQVRHGYGNTMQDTLRKVEYDLYYIKNESLYLDLVIMLRTVSVVLTLGGT